MLRSVRMKRGILVLVTWLAVGAAHADARRHVALLELAGPHGSAIRGELLRIAAAKCWVSSASTLDGRSVRELANEHDLDLVVEGIVKRRGRGYQIQIRFVRGSDGRALAGTTIVVQQPLLDRASRQRIERALARALAAVPPRDDDNDEP